MDESTLLKAALATSIIGIVSLLLVLFLSQSDMETSRLSSVKAMEEGESVLVSGSVIQSISKEEFSIITIEKSEEMKIIAFQNISLKKGDRITVRGKISEYKGEKEIIADQIIKN
ncbi:hypothetical protein JW711_04855 [Candidatus Woesearchaeota archaeon]|nr:hypothetical protein [Candidatus Woesearchaeota archaeon]